MSIFVLLQFLVGLRFRQRFHVPKLVISADGRRFTIKLSMTYTNTDFRYNDSVQKRKNNDSDRIVIRCLPFSPLFSTQTIRFTLLVQQRQRVYKPYVFVRVDRFHSHFIDSECDLLELTVGVPSRNNRTFVLVFLNNFLDSFLNVRTWTPVHSLTRCVYHRHIVSYSPFSLRSFQC